MNRQIKEMGCSMCVGAEGGEMYPKNKGGKTLRKLCKDRYVLICVVFRVECGGGLKSIDERRRSEGMDKAKRMR